MTHSPEIVQALRGLAAGSQIISSLLGGSVAPIVGRYAAEGLGLVADLVAAGADPIVEIERIRDVDPLLREMEQDWRDEMDRRFGVRRPAPQVDPYEEVL